jgi:hypothetical protein
MSFYQHAQPLSWLESFSAYGSIAITSSNEWLIRFGDTTMRHSMRHTAKFVAIAGAAALTATMLSSPAFAGCQRMGFLVNDYGKDGPTKDAKELLDKHIAKTLVAKGITKYTTGTKSVSCELFLNFIVFDEHTCTASATVCWDGTALPKGETVAADPSVPKAAVAKAAAKTDAAKTDSAKSDVVKTSAKPAPKPTAAKVEAKPAAAVEAVKSAEPAKATETATTSEKPAWAAEAAKPAAQ